MRQPPQLRRSEQQQLMSLKREEQAKAGARVEDKLNSWDISYYSTQVRQGDVSAATSLLAGAD